MSVMTKRLKEQQKKGPADHPWGLWVSIGTKEAIGEYYKGALED